MPYINPNIFQIDFDNLDGWADQDSGGGISDVADGKLHLDLRSLGSDGIAKRDKD